MADFIDHTAEVGSEEDEEYKRKPRYGNDELENDSSEEEDDDDEEEAARIRDGFIVDEDDEEEDEDSEAERRRRRLRKKRRREKVRSEVSDEELNDLDDIIEAPKSKFKRLKQGHSSARKQVQEESDDDIFDEGLHGSASRGGGGGYGDDLEDFIEDDGSDEDGGRYDDREIARPGSLVRPAGMGSLEASGLDEATYEDMLQAFGDGNDYLWALELQEEMEAEDEGNQQELELKDVFEPAQLKEKMMTDEDNIIRTTDIPERLQILRQPFKDDSTLPQQSRQLRRQAEAHWITKLLLSRKGFDSQVPEQPLEQAVYKVLEFINEDNLEVPFIFQHRKDYLIHSPKRGEAEGRSFDEENAIRLLDQSDLWDILELDPKFRTMLEKVDALQDTYESIKEKIPSGQDDVFEDLIGYIEEVDEVQDLYDHLSCQYPQLMQEYTSALAETSGAQKRAKTGRARWDSIRSSPVNEYVKAFGISADQFSLNVIGSSRRGYTEDPSMLPEDLADSLISPPDYDTGTEVMKAGMALFVEELVSNPRLRRHLRTVFYREGVINSHRTEQGVRNIKEGDRYYEFKYLKSKPFSWAAASPHKFLRMLQAESEGLLTVEVDLRDKSEFLEILCSNILSDNVSEVAESWNSQRRKAIEHAFHRMAQSISRNVKERVKTECISSLAKTCRNRFSTKLDQAPYKPRGEPLGTVPRVLALTNGNGGNDAIVWAFVAADGRLVRSGKFIDLRPGNAEKNIGEGKDVAAFVQLVNEIRPDVMTMSGFNISAKRLLRQLEDIASIHNLYVTFNDEDDPDRDRREPIDIIVGNDECARLFHTSDRAEREFVGKPPLVKYCVALARYLQSPLMEYASLNKDVTSLSLDPDQDLIPKDKLYRVLETALVDIVNMVGVEINEAVSNSRVGQLLPYVAGLGPRKAANLVKIISLGGGLVNMRLDLLGDSANDIMPVVGPRVFTNCASFLYIFSDDDSEDSEFLDGTRVHPEDYDLARKMAADALELDEEDIQSEMDEYGPGAVVRKLIRENQQDRVNDLVLSEYAEQLYRTFSQLKRATLETIRAELIRPYEEIRSEFQLRKPEEILTMFTGETVETIAKGTIHAVKIRRVFNDHIDVTMSSGIEGVVDIQYFPDRVGGGRGADPRQVFSPQQAVQAAIVDVNLFRLNVKLSLNEAHLKRPSEQYVPRRAEEWDFELEEADKAAAIRAQEATSGRAQRVINHPLFRPFNYPQAEEYLGSQSRGDLVIRPSSRGLDHLTVTWKVSDAVYQHIDVLELDKENEFSLGKILKIGGKYTYSDLDELIVSHVNAMARKVDEMMNDEKFSNMSKQQTDERLIRYTTANPGMIDYAFCINPKYPGYFFLCFKAGRDAPLGNWPVKVIPNAFELQRQRYPDMRALKNGFKLLFHLLANREGGQR